MLRPEIITIKEKNRQKQETRKEAKRQMRISVSLHVARMVFLFLFSFLFSVFFPVSTFPFFLFFFFELSGVFLGSAKWRGLQRRRVGINKKPRR